MDDKIYSDNILDQLPGVVLCTDLNIKFTYCNQQALRTFGFSNQESMLDTTPHDFKCKASENADKFSELGKRAIMERNTNSVIITDVYNDEKPLIHLVNNSVIMKNNEPSGALIYGAELNNKMFFNILNQLILSNRRFNKKINLNCQECYAIEKTYSDNLSPRESECLFYIIRGKTMKSIADIFSISPRTIEKHVESIKRKMKCTTKNQVIEKAIGKGYLSIILTNVLISSSLILALD